MRIDRNVPLRLLAVLALAVALMPWPSGRAAAGAFDTLLGSWQGAGQIRLSDGRTERLKCNAYYTGGGSQLGMAIRCQSETSNVEIRSKLSLICPAPCQLPRSVSNTPAAARLFGHGTSATAKARTASSRRGTLRSIRMAFLPAIAPADNSKLW